MKKFAVAFTNTENLWLEIIDAETKFDAAKQMLKILKFSDDEIDSYGEDYDSLYANLLIDDCLIHIKEIN